MMTLNEFRSLFQNGLVKQNTGLVQLLGLCPLLAISTNIVNALSLGLATMLVMAASSGTVSGVRHFVPHEIRIPVFVLIIAALVTVIDLSMNAFVHPLYLVLGIFIPLITTNCIVLARADAFASKNRPLDSVVDAVAMGLGLTMVLVTLGAIRELAGKGTLFSGIELVFGEAAKGWVLHVLPNYQGFLLAILPPGAFIALGLLIAALPTILKQMPDVKVLLVGGGPQDAALKQQVMALDLKDRVVFTGRVPHAEVNRYYDLVDVLVSARHPMRLTELVTPLKPLEAMAQGRLMVASDVGGHKELIQDGKTGVLFHAGNAGDLASKVVALLKYEQGWDSMKRNGREFVEAERNWAASVARYRGVYGGLVNPRMEAVLG